MLTRFILANLRDMLISMLRVQYPILFCVSASDAVAPVSSSSSKLCFKRLREVSLFTDAAKTIIRHNPVMSPKPPVMDSVKRSALKSGKEGIQFSNYSCYRIC